jgi:hypothetical protein
LALPLLSHGRPGNRGGGRPPSKLRGIATKKFEERIALLGDIADNRVGEVCDKCGRGSEKVSVRDRIRAVHELGMFGLNTSREVEGVLGRDQAKGFVRALATIR